MNHLQLEINTDTLLALLMANQPKKLRKILISEEGLADYLKFVQDCNPMYVSSDFSKEAIFRCVRKYPKLFATVSYTDERGRPHLAITNPTNSRPKMSYFLRNYDESDSKYLNKITSYLLYNIYRKREKRY